jgi:NDP-sugar pyrophosphorylase family protein
VISTRIFEHIPNREFSGIVEHAYQPAMANGERLAGVVDDGLWFDIGTRQRYLDASNALLREMAQGRIPLAKNSRVTDDSLIHITASGRAFLSTVGARSVIEGDVTESIIWDDCRIARGVTLERCIVGHGVELDEGEYRDAVIVEDDPRIPAEHERRNGNVIA